MFYYIINGWQRIRRHRCIESAKKFIANVIYVKLKKFNFVTKWLLFGFIIYLFIVNLWYYGILLLIYLIPEYFFFCTYALLYIQYKTSCDYQRITPPKIVLVQDMPLTEIWFHLLRVRGYARLYNLLSMFYRRRKFNIISYIILIVVIVCHLPYILIRQRNK